MEEPDFDIAGSKLMRAKDTKEVRKLLTSAGPLMIVVYSKICGHCIAMYDTWKELSEKMDGKAKIYVIEATNYTDKDIDGYPNMRIVKKGNAKKYEGGRSVKELSDALLSKSLGGKRSRRNRSKLLVSRVRKAANRTLRRNVTFT